jgi:type II secretory ATPase GspE/PulE/Tfp pilus assembly ATPase PilB-like protein
MQAAPSLDPVVVARARAYGVPVANLALASRQAADAIPERWARRFNVIPLAVSDRNVTVACANPFDVDCERTLAFATGREVRFEYAPAEAIARRIDDMYTSSYTPAPKVPERLVDLQLLTREQESAQSAPVEDGLSVTALVDQLIAQGIAARASDIHIEPEEQAIAVRHRVDGVLRQARTLPRALVAPLVSRIKIISGLDIADRLRPQDGRARVALNGVAVDLRVSTLPASHGEKVVIRVLDGRGPSTALEAIGFDSEEMARIAQLLELREGLILVTGPTGSGKTTTLYAALRRLKDRGVNIVTVEDPIEYRIQGIVQVQVNEKAGLTFATALRSIMRQDPDVVLIGEIRDRETAEIAIQASLTGHLVLSTLHTNDAASAITRLIDIGVAPYKIATAVKGVAAQRLVRRLCAACAGVGDRCKECDGIGFRGRIPIAEIIIGTPEFESRVAAGDTSERLAAVARAGGMRSLWASGVSHVARGATTIDEVARVASPDHESIAPAAGWGVSPPARVVREAPLAGPAFTLLPQFESDSA